MDDWEAVRARLEGTVEGIEPQFATPLVADIRAALERVEEKTKDEQEWYESFHRMMGERDEARAEVKEWQRVTGLRTAELDATQAEVARLGGLILKVDDLCHERKHPLIVLSAEARRIRAQREEGER